MKKTWTFYAFKNSKDFNQWKPYFKRKFYDHAKLKAFSAQHSATEKENHPEYISTYILKISVGLTRSCVNLK